MVLETKQAIELRELSYKVAREMCTPENRAKLEALLRVIESEGNVDGGVAHGLPWRLHRNLMGNWCGYVGVFHDHPMYKAKGEMESELNVHGGVTFSGDVPEWGHGEIWWIGFDTSHFYDAQLIEFSSPSGPIGTYKNKSYMREECEKLAEQLARMEKQDDSEQHNEEQAGAQRAA